MATNQSPERRKLRRLLLTERAKLSKAWASLHILAEADSRNPSEQGRFVGEMRTRVNCGMALDLVDRLLKQV